MFPYQELECALKSDFASAGLTVDDSGLTSDMSIDQVRASMLYRSFYKKLAPLGQSNEAQAAALKKFLQLNDSISCGPFEFPVESEWDSLFWDYFRDNVYKVLTPSDAGLDLAFVRETLAAGPGASLYCDNESFYTKLFASQITVTSPYLLSLYRAAISESDLWSSAEMLRHERFGERIVDGNRLFFVPKTADISRTCCTEPLVNMLIQKAIGAFLEKCLEDSFGVNLKNQPDFNRELARIGSLDGSFGTIDLQSASDSISWALVQRVVPANILKWIRFARCETTLLPDGSKIALNMVSTMGNGFTFPLQTLLFACAVRAVYQMMGLPSSSPRDHFGVFGDDIIVRREAYSFVCTMLAKLGFLVNDTKSFNTGSFRESCGHDWYAGNFVRGVYIRSLETVSDVYSAINRLNRWSALAGVRLPNTIKMLKGEVKELLIPFSESIDGGIQVPFNLTKPKVNNAYWFAYRKLTKRPRRRAVPEDKEGSVALKYRFFNEPGWGVTFLGGFARREDWPLKPENFWDGEHPEVLPPVAYLTLREQGEASRTKVVRGSIPYWDWLGPERSDKIDAYKYNAYEHDPFRFFSFGAWEGAVTANS